jgi:hypothetical protein
MVFFSNNASIFLEPKHIDYFLHLDKALSIPHGNNYISIVQIPIRTWFIVAEPRLATEGAK